MTDENGRSDEPDALLTPAEVATLFRVNPKTVTRWSRAGKLNPVKTLGGHRRFRASEIQRCLHEDIHELRTEQLAQVISAAVSEVGDPRLTLVDVLDDFADAGHGPCAEDADRYVNGLVGSEFEVSSSFHPTTAGYRYEAGRLLEKVGAVR